MPMRGAKAHIRRLQALAGQKMVDEVGAALFAGGEMIQVEAQISITRGAVSGKDHVASAPGEAPNADTHDLSDKIATTQPAKTRVLVTSNSDHAMIEFPSSRVAARPYMRPARDKKRKEVKTLVEKAMSRVVKSSRRSD